jgi:hypothetical protein
MAAANPTPVVDMTTSEVFFKSAADLTRSIFLRINDELAPELDAFMIEVDGELQGLDSKQVATLLLSISIGKALGPKAMLLKNSLDRAVSVTNEIEALSYVVNNLNNEVLYKLDLSLLKRYGFKTKKAV